MTSLAAITASYAPDFELCRDLSGSLLEHTPETVRHVIVVPRRDLPLFSQLKGPRTEVWPVDEMMPRHVLSVPRANFWINAHRVGPPIRGWIMQQLIKIQAATQVDADVLLMVDSDVFFVRPFTVERFRRDGRQVFYRRDAAIAESLPRHLVWHDVARNLLGLPPSKPPLPDYITGCYNPWERRKILALQKRIQEVTGRHWLDAVTRQLHFSENILYGVFVDEILGKDADVSPTESVFCHNYWEPALDLGTAEKFARTIPDDDIAIMISAKSHTPLDIRRSCYSAAREAVR
jgi:Family of unknown function (DUF6492)